MDTEMTEVPPPCVGKKHFFATGALVCNCGNAKLPASEQERAGLLAATQAQPPLQLTDPANVAIVIRVCRQMLYEDRWYRRLRRWAFPKRKKVEVEATVTSIEEASRKRREIDAAGRVVVR